MKKASYLITLILIASGCGDDKSEQPNTKAQEVRDMVMSGKWRITYFFDSDKEETDNFSGYTFDFGSGGTVNATNGPINHPGLWSVTTEGNSSDIADMDFNLSFAEPPDFAELTEDWEIISVSNSKIALKHVSGGNGDIDLLTFENN